MGRRGTVYPDGRGIETVPVDIILCDLGASAVSVLSRPAGASYSARVPIWWSVRRIVSAFGVSPLRASPSASPAVWPFSG
jgi:hypothetical protein